MILAATHIPTGETLQFEVSGSNHQLGRASSSDPTDKFSVPFDPKLSRRTARLTVLPHGIKVERDASRHPLFHEGQEKDSFQLLPGQRFSSAETVFELYRSDAHTLTVQVMEELNSRNAETILKVLLRFQSVLNGWRSAVELSELTPRLLKELMPGAEVAFFQLQESGETSPLQPTTLRPSRSLVAECLRENLPAYHVFSPLQKGEQPTQLGDETWALSAPILSANERLILYAVGSETRDTPGELERSALALVARILSQHLEGRQAGFLAARVEAESRANAKLRSLQRTMERSISLDLEAGFQKEILQGAQELAESSQAHFEFDLSLFVEEGQRVSRGESKEGPYLAVTFERSWPQGLLCRNLDHRLFTQEQEEWLTALVDFTETVFENRRLHNQVRASLEQVKQSQAQVVRSSQWAAAGRLAANAAHELNTPLGAIKLSAETALHFIGNGPKPATDSLNLILRSVDRCKNVTERLLMYSRPKEKTSDQTFNLLEVVEDSIESLQPFLKGKQIDWQCQVEDSLCAFGDVQDAYWAITNVLKNAIEELSAPQIATRVLRASANRLPSRMELRIEDSGPGVPVETGQKIFEPFYSTKKIGQGNGLGLAISRRNLRNWGGDLLIEKSSLGGACLIFHFPLNPGC